jgi:hypothetical protein
MKRKILTTIMLTLLCSLPAKALISDTTGIACLMVREGELQRYDTTRIVVIWSQRISEQTVYVLQKNRVPLWIHEPKERMIEPPINNRGLYEH